MTIRSSKFVRVGLVREVFVDEVGIELQMEWGLGLGFYSCHCFPDP